MIKNEKGEVERVIEEIIILIEASLFFPSTFELFLRIFKFNFEMSMISAFLSVILFSLLLILRSALLRLRNINEKN
jgi:hypothetical protein